MLDKVLIWPNKKWRSIRATRLRTLPMPWDNHDLSLQHTSTHQTQPLTQALLSSKSRRGSFWLWEYLNTSCEAITFMHIFYRWMGTTSNWLLFQKNVATVNAMGCFFSRKYRWKYQFLTTENLSINNIIIHLNIIDFIIIFLLFGNYQGNIKISS